MKKYTIMIVDDEEDIRITIKDLLEKKGYETITAVDGDDALKKWKKQKTDLVLMDIMMPGTSVRKIIPQMTGSKVIYFSVVRTSEAEKDELLNSKNIIGYIQKPFDITSFLETVKKALFGKKITLQVKI